MSKQFVVIGEASESENEDDIIMLNTNIPKVAAPVAARKHDAVSMTAAVFVGEAPESDEDETAIKTTLRNIKDVPAHSKNKSTIAKDITSENDNQYNSILHKKLRENNEKLRKSVCDLFTTTTWNAVKNLSITDKNLLKSQVTLQAAFLSLQSINNNFHQLNEKLQATLDGSFLPDVVNPKDV